MTQSCQHQHWMLGLASSLAIGGVLAIGDCTLAQQIKPDKTLGPENSVVNPNFNIKGLPSNLIKGGAIRGEKNSLLFHSFKKFNVGGKKLNVREQRAYFDNPAGVKIILGRVTENNPSDIQGTLGVWDSANNVLGNADLILINPNGIVFGPNASLDLNGSFLATTVSNLIFDDGKQFSTINPKTPPLLTVSAPVGLQLEETAGSILIQSSSPGLQVKSGQTLALLGGNITLLGGNLTAPEGRIELGSVAGNSQVSLKKLIGGWALGYEDAQTFKDIQLSQNSLVNVNGEGSSGIQVRGKRLVLDTSRISAIQQGSKPGGTLTIATSDSVELSGGSGLFSATVAAGDAGDIRINTGKLLIRDGAAISAESSGIEEDGTFISATGRGGDLTVEASESVELINGFALTSTSGPAGAGDLRIDTGKLTIRDGSQIVTATFSEGQAGNLKVTAPKSVEVTGNPDDQSSTGLFAGAFKLDPEVKVTGQGGNLTITTGNLIVQDLAEVAVSSEGLGKAGKLDITASSILLDNKGALTAETTTSGMGGDITVQARDVGLLRESNISTTAGTEGGPGDGGNIMINTDTLVGLRNSDITANASGGKGGFIDITVQGIFGLEVRDPTNDINELRNNNTSDISASSLEDPSLNGVVQINTPDVDPDEGVVALPERVVDVSGLVAQSCPAGRGAVARGPSEFVATGRGGLPPTPKEALKSDTVLVDLGTPMVSAAKPSPASREQLSAPSGQAALEEPLRGPKGHTENYANSAPSNLTRSAATPVVEAQGWVRRSSGQVVLTAQAPTIAPHRSGLISATCHGS